MGLHTKLYLPLVWGGCNQGSFRITWTMHLISQTYQTKVQIITY